MNDTLRGLCIGAEEKPWPRMIGCDVSMLELFANARFDFVYTATPEASYSKVKHLVRNGGHVIERYEDDGVLEIWRKEDDGMPRNVALLRRAQFAKTALVIRYGGFGDMLIASSVFAALKDLGFHVTVNCDSRGDDVIRHDPNVNAKWLQDKDQVPNEQLGGYWEALGSFFDKTINLSESIEGKLLALPDRREYAMPHEARHELLNVDYLKFTHLLAGVPAENYRPAFYPTAEEVISAKALMADRPGPRVLWCLAGSSVHKVWPWVDKAAEMLLADTSASILFAGDAGCQMLEHAILQDLAAKILGMPFIKSHDMRPRDIVRALEPKIGHKRIYLGSGVLSIRETLAAAQQADVVVGPETGVMWAVAMDPAVAKIVFMSHSSAQQMCQHWQNVTAIEPGVLCHPCHRMHYDSEHCPRDEATGASICAASILAVDFMQAFHKATRTRAEAA
jgi:ADP-heptose:LPS heptosyltransferase